MKLTYLVGDVFERLAELPDDSIDLVMTSPPFLALRSYLPDDHPDKGKEIGSEPNPAEFMDVLLALTAEWERVLAPHGSICVELGDTYSGSGGGGGDLIAGSGAITNSYKLADPTQHIVRRRLDASWPLPKSLCMIPSLYAASLAYGRNLLTGEPSPTGQWRVRNLVAWVRPNPPVGALGDKVRPATSYLTWACKSDKRWFDLDAVRHVTDRHAHDVAKGGGRHGEMGHDVARNHNHGRDTYANGGNPAGAPPLDWWKISPGGYPGSHYAVYPLELCRIPIEASCPRRVCRTCGTPSRREVEVTGMVDSSGREVERHVWASGIADGKAAHSNKKQGGTTTTTTTTGWTTCGCPGTDGITLDGYHTGTGWRPGHVLDPFAGSGTTLEAALNLSRDATGIDIDHRNATLAQQRCGMFLQVP